MSKQREQTWLLVTLGLVLLAITSVIVWQTHDMLVGWPTIAGVVVPWVAFSMMLRSKQDSLGAEGKYLDWWSVPHFTAGLLLGLFGVPLAYVVAIAAVWELVEIYARTREYPANRVVDVILAALGWVAANALAEGSYPLR